MKTINVVAALIFRTAPDGKKEVFASERGYGKWKGWWEFPGGKIEEGEKAEAALVREIREELTAVIKTGGFICNIEYDYPDFHLSMRCYECRIVSGSLKLIEHQDSAWLNAEKLHSVRWLPADEMILKKAEALLLKD